MKLVTFTADYADEFDITGQKFFEDSEYELFKTSLENYENEISIGFGTNEYVEFENGQDVLECFKVVDVKEVPEILGLLELDQFEMFSTVQDHLNGHY